MNSKEYKPMSYRVKIFGRIAFFSLFFFCGLAIVLMIVKAVRLS